ncbi:hypothetical protein KY289_019988 [Solanum tuberosum]|nr:hypothetical protein KY289_019988 [Solanum tuberosum]
MVISCLFNSLHPSLHSSVAFFDTACELWKDLEERFSQGNASRVHQLKMEIVNTQQHDQTMSVYYTKLQGLWDEYGSYSQLPNCSCGAIKQYMAEREKEKVHQFLMGLNDKFNVVRAQILNTEPLPTLAHVYGLVSQEERQQQLTTSRGNNLLEGAAFASKSNTKTFNSHQLSSNRDVSKLFCDHCKWWRHTKEKCFELYGYPDWWENNRKGKGKSANSNRTSEVERVESSPNKWFIRRTI